MGSDDYIQQQVNTPESDANGNEVPQVEPVAFDGSDAPPIRETCDGEAVQLETPPSEGMAENNAFSENGHNEAVLIQLPVQRSSHPSEPPQKENAQQQANAKPRTPEQLEKAKYRQEVYFRMRRKKKKQRILYHRIRKIAKLIFFFVMLGCLYAVISTDYWNYSFNTHGFRLHGNHLLQPKALASILNEVEERPIYQINPIKLENKISKNLTMVEDVHIRRQLFPTRLDITIIEKPVWGLIYHQPPVEPDAQMLPAEMTEATLPEQLREMDQALVPPKAVYLIHWDGTLTDLAQHPLSDTTLSGLHYAVNVVARQTHVTPEAFVRYREIAQVLNQSPTVAKLLYLDVSNPFDIYAQFDGFKVRVGRADRTVIERLNRLFHIVPQIQEHQDEIEFVDLRWNHQITFRKKGDAVTDDSSDEFEQVDG